MRKLAVAGLCGALVVSMVPASAGERVALRTDSKRYRLRQPVRITLSNHSTSAVVFESPWVVRDAKGKAVAKLFFASDERSLEPGGERTWTWDSTPNSCGTDGSCTDVGGWVPAGRYRAVARTDRGKREARFAIGKYFTLGFRNRSVEFTVFSIKPKAIDAMKAEAKAEEKTQIVSGIVRAGRKRYNRDWKFTMGPASIILGEVFVEVCDGSPYHVQRHRDRWEGERWCPWSSYVKRPGR